MNLSGGQWQKIALARAFMCKAEVLVLDEPTSALDAEAKYEVICTFGELMGGRNCILTSHCFPSVHMPDRIAVLSEGRIIELGTHDELIEIWCIRTLIQSAGDRSPLTRVCSCQMHPYLAPTTAILKETSWTYPPRWMKMCYNPQQPADLEIEYCLVL